MATKQTQVTLYKVHIHTGRPHPAGRWVTFTTKAEAQRVYNRCSEGSARLVTVRPDQAR